MQATMRPTEKYDDLYTLRWYRDRRRGQEAADLLLADQIMDGTWPVAVLICESANDANAKWEKLYRNFDINAMTYCPIMRAKDAGLPIKAS